MADRPVPPPSRDETRIAQEAAQWFEALKAAGHTQRGQFAAWLRQSPRHVHYFLRTTALEGVLNQVDPEREFDIPALVREARQNVIAVGREPAGRAARWPRHARMAWGAAAGLALALLTAWAVLAWPWGWTKFQTRTGEQRAVQLADGSIVHLNTASRLQVRLTRESRVIRLIAGEALFSVARDPTRPFSVKVNGSVIHAVGTQFNVYRRLHDTQVSVLEGAVSIPSGLLSAGEAAEIEDDGNVRRWRPADISQAAAWRQRRLIFHATPLSEVVFEFNRYNGSPKIRLEGWAGPERHYTGTFDADDPETFAKVLMEEPAVAVERTQREIVVKPRAGGRAP